jgi:hypothetical protein
VAAATVGSLGGEMAEPAPPPTCVVGGDGYWKENSLLFYHFREAEAWKEGAGRRKEEEGTSAWA